MGAVLSATLAAVHKTLFSNMLLITFGVIFYTLEILYSFSKAFCQYFKLANYTNLCYSDKKSLTI